MKYFLWTLRIVIGVLFIFSGVVKANDPLGLVYKMDEFFQVLSMSCTDHHWTLLASFMDVMSHYSFAFSVTIITFEIVCGVAVLIGFGFRVFSVLLFLLNIIFTFITAYALFSGKVKECGCFGACIKISNEATFYKDVALFVLSLILLIYNKRVTGLFNRHINTAIIILSVVFAVGMQWWVLQHLPFNDCMPYKPGNNILQKMQTDSSYHPAVVESVFIYSKNGQNKEFTAQNYPWQDSTWKFVDRKDKIIKEATGEPEIHDFILTDSNGTDQTQAILNAKGYTFFWFVREPDQAHLDNLDKIRNLAAKAASLHIPFYNLSSSNIETAMANLKTWNLNIQPLTLDGTASKTALRSNPGLMLIKDGTVQKKWSYRDYPSDMTLSNGQMDIK